MTLHVGGVQGLGRIMGGWLDRWGVRVHIATKPRLWAARRRQDDCPTRSAALEISRRNDKLL